MAAALQNREEHGWGVILFEGILWLLVGVVALIWPGITALSFLYLLAAWAVITGILELIAPLSFPMSGGRGLLMALSGLVSIVFGIIIAVQPASGLLAVTWLIGIYAIVFGILHLVAYFEARSAGFELGWTTALSENDRRLAHDPLCMRGDRERRVEEGICDGDQ